MRYRRLMVLLGCVALAPLAVQAGPNAERPDPGARWAALDTDGNGTISLAEAQAGAPRMAEHFQELDVDADGQLTRQEMQAAREKFRADRRARGEEHFKAADTNGDGAIDLAEAQQGMPRVAEHFSELDADNNGLVTRDELRSAMRAHHGAHKRHGQPPSDEDATSAE